MHVAETTLGFGHYGYPGIGRSGRVLQNIGAGDTTDNGVDRQLQPGDAAQRLEDPREPSAMQCDWSKARHNLPTVK